MDSKTLLRFDLNLIKVFLAISDAGSLTIAAHRLGLTQPAVSHALKRLRHEFGDPLFVRSGKRMEPTQTAIGLRATFEAAMQLVGTTMRKARSFDPQSATRQFRIALTDTGELVMLPRLLAALQDAAPGVSVCSIRVPPEDLASALRTGQVDAAIGYQPRLAAMGCVGRLLTTDRIVCLFRVGHPLADRDWSVQTFASLTFLDVAPDATGYRMARQKVADLGVPYRMAAQVYHFTVLPEIIRRTDHAALFPVSVLVEINRHGEFDHRELPFDVPPFDVNFWVHESFASDPGLNWLFDLLSRTFSA